MNNTLVLHSVRFIALLLVQVSICNNINFLGYINPYIYIVFIFLFPTKDNNRMLFLLCSFLLGMLLDMFLDSGGVHAAASVFLAYVRPLFLKVSFGTLYEYQTIKFHNTELRSLITYITLGTLLHHFIMFSLEVFSFMGILLVLKKALFSSIFTILLSIIIIILFSRNKK